MSFSSFQISPVLEIIQIHFSWNIEYLNLLISSFYIRRDNYNFRPASNCCYALPKTRTNYGKFALKFAGVKAWNAIEVELKQIASVSLFKKLLKKSILKNYEIKPWCPWFSSSLHFLAVFPFFHFSLIYSFVHLLICSFVYLFIYLFSHVLINQLNYN